MKNINCETFLNQIASTQPVPSGGAVIGFTGALAASLAEMVANLAVNNKRYKDYRKDNLKYKEQLNKIAQKYLSLITLDEQIFSELSKVYKLPSSTEDEKLKKQQELNSKSIKACEAPISMISLGEELKDTLKSLINTTSPLTLSDIGVCASLTESVLKSCWLTIEINRKNITEFSYNNELDHLKRSLDSIIEELNKIYIKVETRLQK